MWKNTSVLTLLVIRRSQTAHAPQSSPSLEKPFNSTGCIGHRSCLFMLVWRSHQWILLPPLLSDEAAYLGAPPHLSFGPRSDKVTREWQSRLQLSRYEAFQGFTEKRCNLSASHTHTHMHAHTHAQGRSLKQTQPQQIHSHAPHRQLYGCVHAASCTEKTANWC